MAEGRQNVLDMTIEQVLDERIRLMAECPFSKTLELNWSY